MNVLGGTDIVNKNTESLVDACKEVCLERDVDKAKYLLLSHHNAGQNHYIKIAKDRLKVYHILDIWERQ
jgi:hypothetical protein